MNFDISQLLSNWDYQPGNVVVRKFKGRDGVEKIQLRVDLGLLQMNVHGRPDGKRPFGHESLLQHYRSQLEKYRLAHSGSDQGFQLKPDDCARIQQEALQYHHRYICFFQLEEFALVVRDSDRNIEAFDFVTVYSGSDDLSWSLQQFRPQLMMMRTRARGSLAIAGGNFESAIDIVEAGLEDLRGFYREYNRADLLEQSGEVQSLEFWLQELRSRRPVSEREKLETALDDAVRREDYEKAAQVRDALRNLKT